MFSTRSSPVVSVPVLSRQTTLTSDLNCAWKTLKAFQPGDFVFASGRKAFNVFHAQFAGGQRAGLVEADDIDLRSELRVENIESFPAGRFRFRVRAESFQCFPRAVRRWSACRSCRGRRH